VCNTRNIPHTFAPSEEIRAPRILVQFISDSVIKTLCSFGMETILTNGLYIKLFVFAFLETALDKECFTHFVPSDLWNQFYIFLKI
jgi:hypothetical protein